MINTSNLDPLAMIVGLLKDPISGLGTGDYKVLNDLGEECKILVSYTLSEEELKDQFRDFDTIVTVKRPEETVREEGSSLCQWEDEVEITVNLIDKWSGLTQPKATAHVVKAKVTDKIRSFIRAHMRPSETVQTRWELMGVKPEYDMETRPHLLRDVIQTRLITIIAKESFLPKHDVALDSECDQSEGVDHLGSIRFKNDTYPSLPQTIERIGDTYSILFSLSDEDYEFDRWQGTDCILTGGGETANPGDVRIYKDCSLKALYNKVKWMMDLASREVHDINANLGSINGQTLPKQVKMGVDNNDISYTPSDLTYYKFEEWETEGECSVANPDDNPSVVDVVEGGMVRAVYRKYKFDDVQLSLREHKKSSGYNPSIIFSRFSYSGQYWLRCLSEHQGVGDGYIFLVVPASYLQNKYLKIRWRGEYENEGGGGGVGIWSIFIRDGKYDRASDVDFPSGSAIPSKGNGLLLTIRNVNAGSEVPYEWEETYTSSKLSYTPTQDFVTLFIKALDNWIGNWVGLSVEWVQILDEDGSTVLLKQECNADPTMERTGTYGDYGHVGSEDAEVYLS